jgi:agmatinase
MINYLKTEENFLGIEVPELFSYDSSSVVIQSVPYEHTSSYQSGSFKGPAAIIETSHYVEFYDEELDQETFRKTGICTLEPLKFDGLFDKAAVDFIEAETLKHLNNGKFVISLGAEHTVTYGLYKAMAQMHPDVSVLQIDAHSDLRQAYHDNPYSHASVMARIHDHKPLICQAGIRAQCKEEADLIKASDNIHTWYAHQIRQNTRWQDEIVKTLKPKVYITIDADGFDPSVIPNVGTAEPGGLLWFETLELLKKVCMEKEVVGFDIVEVAPQEGGIISEYTLAQLLYRILGYLTLNPKFNQKYCRS